MKCVWSSLFFGWVYENLKHFRLLCTHKAFAKFHQRLIIRKLKRFFHLPPTTRHVSKTSSPYTNKMWKAWRVEIIIGFNYAITSSLGPKVVPFNWRPHRLRTTGYSGRTGGREKLKNSRFLYKKPFVNSEKQVEEFSSHFEWKTSTIKTKCEAFSVFKSI